MVVLDSSNTLQALANALGKPCMYISWVVPEGAGPLAVLKAAPYLKDCDQVLCDQAAYLMFDTVEEMDKTFGETAGDGSKDENERPLRVTVYALTCGADGVLRRENT